MAYRSVMAPAGAPSMRDVIVEMPDGSIQPVASVPEGVSDDDVAKKFGGRVMSKTEDVARSALSGIPSGLSEAATAIPKALLGLRRFVGAYEPEEWRQKAEQVQRLERSIKEPTGANYAPRTTAGEYSKAITSGAIPLPGGGPPAVQAALGATSGVASKGAEDLGFGMGGSTVASMLPFLLAGGVSAVGTRHPQVRTREALEALTPEQRATMYHNMAIARRDDLPIMAWQAAPEGSELRSLGQAVASQPGATRTRAVQTQQSMQITGDRAIRPAPPQPASQRIAGPMYQRSGQVEIAPDQVRQIRDSVLGVIAERNLTPNHPDAAYIRRVANLLGDEVPVPVDVTVSRLQEQQRQTQRGSPEFLQLNREIVDRLNGRIPPETEFVTPIRSFAELQSQYREIPYSGDASRIGADEGLRRAMRGAIARVADQINPQFAEARRRHADLRDLERISSDTSTLRRQQNLELQPAATTDVLPEIMYGAATTPMWAAIPLIRRLGRQAIVNRYDRAFSDQRFGALQDLARERPLARGAQYVGGGLLAPFRQGEFQFQEEEDK